MHISLDTPPSLSSADSTHHNISRTPEGSTVESRLRGAPRWFEEDPRSRFACVEEGEHGWVGGGFQKGVVARQDTLCPVARPAPRTASHRGCETRAKDSTSHLEPLLGTWELGNKPPSRSRGRAACAVVGRGRCEGHKESVGEEERRPPDLFDIDRGVVGEGQACLVDDALTLVGALHVGEAEVRRGVVTVVRGEAWCCQR